MTFNLLGHLRVIESSAFIAAPLAGLTLAQFGADVIRIDMIGGGIDYRRMPLMPNGRSLYWTGLNKGKRSIAIDLRKQEGRELAQALVVAGSGGSNGLRSDGTGGDVGGILLTNIGTEWLSHGTLSKQRSDVITCTISGNPDGSTAVDYTVNCATGYPMVTGGGSVSAPVNHVLPAWDVACAFQAALAVLAASIQRDRKGLGAELKLSLSDVAFSMLSHLGVMTEAELTGIDRENIGNHIYGAFGRDFVAATGERVMVAGISAGQWKSLVRACDLGPAVGAIEARLGVSLDDEAARYAARDEIAVFVDRWFAERPWSVIQPLLEQHRVCWGPYRTVTELLRSDERVSLGNPVFEQMHTAGIGSHRAAGTPVRIEDVMRQSTSPAPLLGQNTDEVLHELLKLDSGAIGKLQDAGVVAGADRDPLRS